MNNGVDFCSQERIRKQLEEKQAIALEQQKALERVQKEIKAKKVISLTRNLNMIRCYLV